MARLAPVLEVREPLMRVVHFVPKGFPRLGGSERQAGLLARALSARGVSCSILAPRGPGERGREEVSGIPVRRFGFPRLAAGSYTLGYRLPLRSALRKALASSDGIHFHGINASAVAGAETARRLGRWSVAKAATAGPEGDLATLAASPRGRLRVERAARAVDRFIAVSGELAEEMRRIGIPESKIVHIPNGVDTARFAPLQTEARRAARERLGWGPGPVAMASGRLVPRKRVDRVLEALGHVRQQGGTLRLAVLGDGPEREALVRRASQLGISGAVSWVGAVDDPERYLPLADVFIHAASSEGLPNALLEAMACGVPVVAPRIGGVLDAVADGTEGILFDGEDPAAIARAARAAPELDRSAPRLRIEREFSIDRTAARVLDLYRGLA